MRYVEVKWVDAHGGIVNETGWTPVSDLRGQKPREVVTVGLLIDENEFGLTLALSYEALGEVADQLIFVPKVNIASVTDLVKKRVRG